MNNLTRMLGACCAALILAAVAVPATASAAPAPREAQQRPAIVPGIIVAAAIRQAALKAAPQVAKGVGKKAAKKAVKPKARTRIRGSAKRVYRWAKSPQTRAALATSFMRLPKAAQGCGSGLYTHWDLSPSAFKMILACGRGIVEVVIGGKNPLSPRNS